MHGLHPNKLDRESNVRTATLPSSQRKSEALLCWFYLIVYSRWKLQTIEWGIAILENWTKIWSIIMLHLSDTTFLKKFTLLSQLKMSTFEDVYVVNNYCQLDHKPHVHNAFDSLHKFKFENQCFLPSVHGTKNWQCVEKLKIKEMLTR